MHVYNPGTWNVEEGQPQLVKFKASLNYITVSKEPTNQLNSQAKYSQMSITQAALVHIAFIYYSKPNFKLLCN